MKKLKYIYIYIIYIYIYCLCDTDVSTCTDVAFLQKIENYNQLETQISCDRQIFTKYYV